MRFQFYHISPTGSGKGGDQEFNKATKEAMQAWGSGPVVAKNSNGEVLALRREGLPETFAERLKAKWLPKRDLWAGDCADSSASFGVLREGHEVNVFVTKKNGFEPGVVIAIDEENQRVAVSLADRRSVVDVKMGEGDIRRPEDARELCTEKELRDIARFRTSEDARALAAYASQEVGTPQMRSLAVVTLCRMDESRRAWDIANKHLKDINTVALREIAHSCARENKVTPALEWLEHLPKPLAAQLLVEVLALSLSHTVANERERIGVEFLRAVDTNEKVKACVEKVCEVLPRLEAFAEATRSQPALVSRKGLSEAFNELLQSCGRAHCAPVSFRVLEWMERLAIPKDAFTYEAIGLNVVKRVKLARKVWDLPNAPEDSHPEVVFAGRSNVGKSSLVNMLLGRLALAPTSQRPGRTKTMDFFDVNAGHPSLPRFRLVDVPGLGYARASKELRERWIQLIGGYFVARRSLKLIFHLLDAELCEIMSADHEIWKLLAQSRRKDFELCICLTKADNTYPQQLERFATQVRNALRKEGSDLATHATIFACSAKSRLGKDTLWRKIWTAIGGDDLDGAGPPVPLATAPLNWAEDGAQEFQEVDFVSPGRERRKGTAEGEGGAEEPPRRGRGWSPKGGGGAKLSPPRRRPSQRVRAPQDA